ncbi:NADPH-dependent FMN reductase [Arsukibacterium indicum]|uniref:NAD(P)H-dependent oxidoreductase n=1 Tax=Arsukibacterium indicum TaxID=2848612 RepID=A0ABS6MNX3_9GAMM|nr:NAD(P)H-dependent oxidoreductase [Arsukibacterium indicum]MBV2130527.1 NAD(P)H-dependent oxidoreductase [Arsukibacterium indicum]
MSINVLAICGSLRAKSTNRGLVRYAMANSPDGMKIHLADLMEVPFYNADLGEKPAAVQTLLQQMAEADALLLACPEYNYSLAPALKNALDWASREPDNHLLSGKPVAIMGSAAGMGSSRSQYHLRQVCVYLNLHPLNQPEVFANAFSGAFDNDGDLTDDKIQANVRKLLAALLAWQQRLNGQKS